MVVPILHSGRGALAPPAGSVCTEEMGDVGVRLSVHRAQRGPFRRATAIAVVGLVAGGLAPVSGPAAAPAVRFRSPVPLPPVPVTAFDPPDQPWLAGHRGVDLASEPLAPVVAPATATVLFAGSVGGKPVVSLDHGGGLRTTYEPVAAAVSAGDMVTAGQPIGHLVAGHPGCPVEACLHWGARVASRDPGGDDDEYIDPMALMLPSDLPIRLKPTRPGDGER